MVEFKDTGEEATFRTVVRDFIGSEYEPRREQIRTEGRQAAMFDRTPSMRAWEGELAQRGWIAPAWPEQYGGAGLSVMKQFIFNEEMAEARARATGRHRDRYGRAHADHDRHRGAAGRASAADPQRRG